MSSVTKNVKPFLGLTFSELQTWCTSQGLPKHRAIQAFEHVYRHNNINWNSCSTFDKATRTLFTDHWPIDIGELVDEQISGDGTIKWVWGRDKSKIESVLISEPERKTLCVSCQVGCSLSCTFCHTGTQKLLCNLTKSDIVAQLMAARHRLNCLGKRLAITNVVFMGQGEPLYNFRNVAGAINVFADLMDISRGRITVSTSGIAPMIPKVATELETMLAISLHAPNNALRSQIMSINNSYPIETLIQACLQFVESAKCARRRITFEYVMLDQVNDSEELAYELGELVKPLKPHINLIPFNAWPGAPYQSTPKSRIKEFGKILTEEYSIPTTIRWSKGTDIMAACGQLAAQSEDE